MKFTSETCGDYALSHTSHYPHTTEVAVSTLVVPPFIEMTPLKYFNTQFEAVTGSPG